MRRRAPGPYRRCRATDDGALRAEPALRGCRMVALSADAMPAHIEAARSAGLDDYWTKPIEFERFLARIASLAADKLTSN